MNVCRSSVRKLREMQPASVTDNWCYRKWPGGPVSSRSLGPEEVSQLHPPPAEGVWLDYELHRQRAATMENHDAEGKAL